MKSRLETERLVLRHLTLDDAELMLAVWNDPDFIRYVGDRGIRTLADARDTLEDGALAMYEDLGYGPYRVTLKASNEDMGTCGLFKRDILQYPDIGFAVLPDYCGKGLAGEAAFAVLAHARDDLGLQELTAIVSLGNTASIGLIEKLGLEFRQMIRMPGDDEDIRLYSMELNR